MTLTNSMKRRRRTTGAGPRARAGFTILEMLTVVILASIIMAVAGARVAEARAQQRVVRAAGIVQTDLEFAFALAQRNRAPTRIDWTPSTLLLRVTNRDASTEYKRTNFMESSLGLSTGDATASSSSITVFPNGFASDTFSITFSKTWNGKTFTRRVRMSRAGLVKVM